MGVLNVTPDSFSDGGRFGDPVAAIMAGVAMADAGAAIVDVGGESTRPGYRPVPPRVQIERIVPVIAGLRAATPALISVDTTRAEVAAAAIAAGADIVNDTMALNEDPALADVVVESGASLVLMHRFTPPRTAADQGDVVADVAAGLGAGRDRALARGVDPTRLYLDPGLGFGTRPDDVPILIARIAELRRLGCPLVVGPSRKSFLQHLTGRAVGERLAGTAAAVAALALAGVEIVRVHDVAAMHDVVLVASAIRAGGRLTCQS